MKNSDLIRNSYKYEGAFSSIIGYLKSIGIKPIRKTNDQYASPCPFCGGKDRFIIWIDDKGGSYWCRRCPERGRLFRLIEKTSGRTYSDVKSMIDLRHPVKTGDSQANSPAPRKKKQVIDWDLWHRTVKRFYKATHSELRHNRQILSWLMDERGISKQTALKAGLGFNPSSTRSERFEWGLSEEEVNGKLKQVHTPEGLVIPKFRADGELVRLRFRVTDRAWNIRYILLPGSKVTPLLFGSPASKRVLIVESELDAILLHQEISDVRVIALGSSTNKLTNRQLSLLSSKKVYISLDNDDPGIEASARLKGKYPMFHILPIVGGKDHTEAMMNGLDLNEWFNEGRRIASL